MYQESQLAIYPFFKKLLSHVSLTTLHDSLTGLIARPYMIEFVRSLIAEHVPFTLAILDLDNFKLINDSFGHRTGDLVLAQMAENIQDFVGSSGLVGRYGGDELLLVYFDSNDYDDIHAFYDKMYGTNEERTGLIFRRRLNINDISIYITGTLGSASYPDNATDFESLFALTDKCLYRGKTKGRNCFIIYVPAKHDHLNMSTLSHHSLYETYRKMTALFAEEGDAMSRLRNAFHALRISQGFQHLLWLDGENTLRRVDSGEVLGQFAGVESLLSNGLYAPSSFMELGDKLPELRHCLDGLLMDSAIFVQIGHTPGSGCLIVSPEDRARRIWQDSECASVYVLAALLDAHLRRTEEDHGNR